MTPRAEVSVVTVTFNSGTDAVDGLSCLVGEPGVGMELEVIVVDNASTDGSAERVAGALPRARLIRNERNIGFGAANNIAFRMASGDPILLLNPDARLTRASLAELGGFLAAHPSAGIVAPTLRGPGGVESAGAHPGIRSLLAQYTGLNRILPGGGHGPWRGFGIPRRRTPEPVLVDWVSAAAMVVRADALRAVGGFDESIFLYGEDIDLCRRVREAGYEIWLLPRAEATHTIAGSQSGISTRWVDGLHEVCRRDGGRLPGIRLLACDLVLAVGLAARSLILALPGHSGSQAHHRRRLAASALRALRLAFGARPVEG